MPLRPIQRYLENTEIARKEYNVIRMKMINSIAALTLSIYARGRREQTTCQKCFNNCWQYFMPIFRMYPGFPECT